MDFPLPRGVSQHRLDLLDEIIYLDILAPHIGGQMTFRIHNIYGSQQLIRFFEINPEMAKPTPERRTELEEIGKYMTKQSSEIGVTTESGQPISVICRFMSMD